MWFLVMGLPVTPSPAVAQSAEEQTALAEATRLIHEAIALYRAGKFAQAEPLFRQVLAIAEKALGPEHPNVATSLNNLAGLYDAQGQYAQAEPLYRRALAIFEKALGPEHPKVATSLENYATLLRKTQRPAEAETLEARAKAIRAKHGKPGRTK
jgi:tetratricopeptide (TPR) repeat protein